MTLHHNLLHISPTTFTSFFLYHSQVNGNHLILLSSLSFFFFLILVEVLAFGLVLVDNDEWWAERLIEKSGEE